MVLIEWRDEFATGERALDHEHKELIDLINGLYGSLRAKRAGAREVGEFLGEINARISAHFALEERMMRSAGHAGYDAHKQDHERLLDDIREIMIANDAGAYADFAEILARHLTGWFTTHFATFDAELHGELRVRE